MHTSDFLVVGGGVVGVCVARALKSRFGGRVRLIEKEPECGLHASGRNSGVIHAGFYYSADSLKAKFTRAGNRALTAYCESKGIPLNRCGKLVVAQGPADLPQLDELLRRGRANDVPLESISEEEARKIEPRVKTLERAIFSPTTSSADPARVIAALKEDAQTEGVEVTTGAAYLRMDGGAVVTSAGRFEAGHVVNAAGLYADQIALDFGFSEKYRILPFKGLYLYSEEPVGAFRTNIYPVPDLRNPFLGVHFTVKADGRIKIGPTAIPAFWREQYRGFDNFKFGEFVEVLFREAGLMFSSNFDFKKLAIEEIQKYSRPHLVSLAARLAQGVRPEDYRQWGEPGIRSQLLNIKERKLEMDFVVEGDAGSTHILNAVSPGWTCAMPFAEYVVDGIEKRSG
jgi:L-2-hydroxyglutarate oxidase LhgO